MDRSLKILLFLFGVSSILIFSGTEYGPTTGFVIGAGILVTLAIRALMKRRKKPVRFYGYSDNVE